MISLTQKHEILRMYLYEEKSIKSIVEISKTSRNTIRKYIREYEKNREKILKDKDQEAKDNLIKLMTEEPKYNTCSRKPRVMTQEIKDHIEFYLKQNETRTRKQKMNSKDIFEALKSKGIGISYGTVNNAVKIMSKKSKEAFIKQEYSLGDIVEFDWGEVKLIVNGEQKTFKMAVFTSAYNNYRFAYLYPKEATEFFLDAHVKFFEQIGGVYKTVVYDNMRVAVAKFLGKGEKEATIALQSISKYYGFNYRFCNVRRGNEKGHVEKSVDVARSRAFKENIEFESTAEANKHLLNKLEEENSKILQGKTQSANNSLKEELQHMLPIMPAYDVSSTKELRVDKYSTIRVDGNRYSVPDHLVGEFVTVKIYPEYLEIYKETKHLTKHTRHFGLNKWSLDIYHYRKTLLKKPGALKGSLAFKNLEKELKVIYFNHFENSPKEFVKLLDMIVEYSLEIVTKTINKLEKQRVKVDLSTIKLLIERNDYSDIYLENETNKVGEIQKKSFENAIEYNSIFNINNSLMHKEMVL